MNPYAKPAESPPLIPGADATVADDPSFSARCLSLINKFISEKNVELHQPVLTKEDKWGLVLRVDFTMHGGNVSTLVNRITCWLSSDGKVSMEVAVGQRLAPLY